MQRARAEPAGGRELESQLGHLLSTAGQGVQPRWPEPLLCKAGRCCENVRASAVCLHSDWHRVGITGSYLSSFQISHSPVWRPPCLGSPLTSLRITSQVGRVARPPEITASPFSLPR